MMNSWKLRECENKSLPILCSLTVLVLGIKRGLLCNFSEIIYFSPIFRVSKYPGGHQRVSHYSWSRPKHFIGPSTGVFHATRPTPRTAVIQQNVVKAERIDTKRVHFRRHKKAGDTFHSMKNTHKLGHTQRHPHRHTNTNSGVRF